MAGIYVPPDLQESEYLVGAHEERGSNRPIRHHYGPSIVAEMVNQKRDELADRAPNAGIVNHVVCDGEPEDRARVLITGRISNPDVTRRAVGVNPVSAFLAPNACGESGINPNKSAGLRIRTC